MLDPWEVVSLKEKEKGITPSVPCEPSNAKSILGRNRQLQGVDLPDWAILGWSPKAGYPGSLTVSNKMSVASPGSMEIN